ncbi:large-conductance mechanosensitive channel protein MscL [Aureliella helgolandensis]|uniref:Large-conductance mechanosensitive channel n=1 Tax=Aureliella helgolandensis TaxID=2527968 RepID=A0A518G2D8_9BACT|nr:large-conductance mechanosensitive channel protein MscL [Aureliella helgolandensis]QDV22787.1 Large-conductance mechanosensitive channel [Aureliella helgolandensis]|tara:strand:- start:143 stop:610 length:468 start_codon:yes stop_codon:yes gene_type:complete
MSLVKEFREFAMRGNVIDLAVGVVIGGAFQKIVSSFVANIVMPPLNLLTAKANVNFNELALRVKTEAPVLDDTGAPIIEDGVAKMETYNYAILNYGALIQTIFDFLLIAIAIFLAVKMINTAKARFEKEEEAAPKAPSEDIVLLREIRDSLNNRS